MLHSFLSSSKIIILLLVQLSIVGKVLGEVIELYPENFDEVVLDSNIPTLVDFYAPWCGHCNKLTPLYFQLARVFETMSGKLQIAKLNADSHKDFANKYHIKSFPTIKLFSGVRDEAPIDYFGPRDLSSFFSFISNEVGIYPAKELADFVSKSTNDYGSGNFFQIPEPLLIHNDAINKKLAKENKPRNYINPLKKTKQKYDKDGNPLSNLIYIDVNNITDIAYSPNHFSLVAFVEAGSAEEQPVTGVWDQLADIFADEKSINVALFIVPPEETPTDEFEEGEEEKEEEDDEELDEDEANKKRSEKMKEKEKTDLRLYLKNRSILTFPSICFYPERLANPDPEEEDDPKKSGVLSFSPESPVKYLNGYDLNGLVGMCNQYSVYKRTTRGELEFKDTGLIKPLSDLTIEFADSLKRSKTARYEKIKREKILNKFRTFQTRNEIEDIDKVLKYYIKFAEKLLKDPNYAAKEFKRISNIINGAKGKKYSDEKLKSFVARKNILELFMKGSEEDSAHDEF